MATRGKKGKLAKSVMVFSNDPKTPRLELKISADIQVLLSLEPDRIFMRQVLKGSQQSQTVKLVGSLLEQAKILAVESSRPELKAVLSEDKREIQLSFQAPAEPQRFSATVKVTTDQEAAREINLPVTAEVTGELVLNSTFVMFTPFDPASPSTGKVTVRSLAGKPFKITKVEDPTGAVSASFTPKGTPPGTEIEVLLKLEKAPPAPRGSLRLVTDRKDQPALNLQYNVRSKTAGPGRPVALPPLSRGAEAGPAPGQPGQPVERKLAPLQRTPLQLKVAPSRAPAPAPAPAPPATPSKSP